MVAAPSARGRPFSVGREEARRAWRELRGPRSTPLRAAASVALGVFIGSIPIFGLHTPIVLALCLWFQLDAAMAWVASNISNPFFAPALLTAELQVGGWLWTGALLHVEREAGRAGAVGHFVAYTFLGAPIREPYRLPDDAPPWFRAVERVATRFASPASADPAERTRFHYLRGKLLADPIARLLADGADGADGAHTAGEADRTAAATDVGARVDAPAEPPASLGAVLDVGCGRGQVALLLLELGHASSVHGVDWDERKIAIAQRAAAPGGDGIERVAAVFVRGDARTAAFPPSDTVLLIDLLHYFADGEQDAILDRAAAAVRPGGRLIVREADTERGWRSLVTLAEERFFTFVRLNRGERVRFRPARQIVARLEAAGLRCSVQPAWGATPFSNVLVFGRRAA
jgi:SAM-dependent methyltransferase